MKKIYILILLFISLFTLSSCYKITSNTNNTYSNEDMVILPDLMGKNTKDAIKILNDLGIDVLVGFDQTKYWGNLGYGKFVKYQGKKSGQSVLKNSTLRIISRPFELPNIDVTALKFTRNATNKSFIDDSYGYCTWTGKYADGDTTSFIDIKTNKEFTVRFLGINCPEVYHGPNSLGDPWGDSATKRTKELLKNAKTIIVESESDTQTTTDTYGRYLAYVWADGILINYVQIAEAYSNFTGNENNKYGKLMSEADFLCSTTGRRFYGEYDPDYKYYD